MEKIYTKTGYSITDKSGNVKNISKATIEKSIVDLTKLSENLAKNLENLKKDLVEISKI